MNSQSWAVALLGACLMAALTMSGCKSGESAPAKGDPAAIYGGWTLDWLEGKEVAPMLPAGGKAPNMTITSDGKVTGFGGVNRFSGTLDRARLADGGFTLGPVAATKMAGTPQAMELEGGYFAALDKATSYTVSAKGLSLLDGRGEVLHFSKR